MEIFQAIWTALTNENELLVNIICIPLTFVEAYLSMLVFTNVLNMQPTRKQKTIYVVTFSLVTLFNLFVGNTLYYTFINVLSMPLLVFLIFKTNIMKAILSEIISYITCFVIITPLILAYSNLLNISSDIINIIPLHKICFCIIYDFFLFVFNLLIVKLKLSLSIIDKVKYKNYSILIINFLIGTIALGLNFYLLFKYIDFIPNFLIFSTSFVLLLYFGISMFSLIRTNKLELTTQSLEEQKMYNKTLTTLHDNIRGFKHDFDNIIQAVGGYLSTNNIDGLQTYYKDLLEECQINNNLSVLNPELINNPAIYSLLSDKYYKSEELGIKMNLEVMMDLSNLNIKMYELTRILGVLFDNAIEAASKCDIKTVNIIFRKDKKRNKDLIIIQNTYINKDVNINKIFEKGYTSKQEHEKDKNHGLGLWEVRKYLRKNHHLDLYTTKTDNLFTQQFEIYN